jgi:hypothetical protein
MKMAITIIGTIGMKINIMFKVARAMNRSVFTTRKKIVYTIHGTSSVGFSCKEKETIAILKFFLSGCC